MMAMSVEPASPCRNGQAGVTLVETLVAMALFALIGMAGFAVVDSVLRVQSRSDTRLEALTAIQRAMLVVTLDIEQSAGGPLVHANGTLSLARAVAGSEDVTVRYSLTEDGFTRRVVDIFGTPRAEQRLLEDATALTWRFYTPVGGWIDIWPPEDGGPDLPLAIEAVLHLGPDGRGYGGDLRRVALLPAAAQP